MNDKAESSCPINAFLPDFQEEPGFDAVKERLWKSRDFANTLPVGQECVRIAYDAVLQQEIAPFLLADSRRVAEACLLIFDANSELEMLAAMDDTEPRTVVFSTSCVERARRLVDSIAESVPTVRAPLRAFSQLLSELAGLTAENALGILASQQLATSFREAWP